MTKDQFIVNQRALKRFGLTIGLLFIAGLALFGLWGSHLPGGTSPLFKVSFCIYLFVGSILVVWLNFRRQKQLGACCPRCQKRFHENSARIVIATGKCGYCGERILDVVA